MSNFSLPFQAFDKLAPDQVTGSEFESGGENIVGSVCKLTYKDGSVWSIRVTEVSEKNHSICYEIISTAPKHNVTSVQGEIKLLSVTTEDSSYIQWTTECKEIGVFVLTPEFSHFVHTRMDYTPHFRRVADDNLVA